jgi:hypothetical protein
MIKSFLFYSLVFLFFLLKLRSIIFPVGGRSLEGIKLVECKAYLKKIGLSQTGDIATCIDRIMLHWRLIAYLLRQSILHYQGDSY